jgi:adenosyl cobinamide kinase/adenosyl cobinamide phosphate guanylyltransferase
MRERIEQHRHERPPGWQTVEEPLELGRALGSVAADETAILDCLSLWVANAMAVQRDPDDDALQTAAGRQGLTIAVSNEVGMGIVPVNALAREYRDVLGRVNAAWVGAADEAYFVVAGKTVKLA